MNNWDDKINPKAQKMVEYRATRRRMERKRLMKSSTNIDNSSNKKTNKDDYLLDANMLECHGIVSSRDNEEPSLNRPSN